MINCGTHVHCADCSCPVKQICEIAMRFLEALRAPKYTKNVKIWGNKYMHSRVSHFLYLY